MCMGGVIGSGPALQEFIEDDKRFIGLPGIEVGESRASGEPALPIRAASSYAQI